MDGAKHGLGRSGHFNVVGEDRLVVEFHGGVLGELLGIIRRGSALNDEAAPLAKNSKIANPIPEPTHDPGGEFRIFAKNRGSENTDGHETPSFKSKTVQITIRSKYVIFPGRPVSIVKLCVLAKMIGL